MSRKRLAPGAEDGVRAWLAPTLATRLEVARIRTIAELLARINGVGARWWTTARGIGPAKAAGIVDFLRQHEGSIGQAVGSHVLLPRSELQAVQLDAVVQLATAVVPFEKFVVPAELDGSAGRFRAPLHQFLLEARNDYEAIAAWLITKHDPQGSGKTSTHRAYRKEAERLLLWAILERSKPLSSLTVEDANAFKALLSDPPERWCGPRHHQRWSPLWRPLEGPLGAGAVRQALVIVRSLFAFLVSQNYLLGNAFAGVSLPRQEGRVLGSRRTLTFAQWDAVEARLAECVLDAVSRRRAQAVRWLYATGLRLAEMANVRCGDLEKVDYRLPDRTPATGWLLSVVGKGGKARQVPAPAQLVAELEAEFERYGREPDVQAESNRQVAILARFNEGDEGGVQPWSASGLANAIKTLLGEVAATLGDEDAEQLRKASTHWLRHTHGSHALNGRPGEQEPVPFQVVQNNLGHASIGTTSGYLTTERDTRLAAIRGFGNRSTTVPKSA